MCLVDIWFWFWMQFFDVVTFSVCCWSAVADLQMNFPTYLIRYSRGAQHMARGSPWKARMHPAQKVLVPAQKWSLMFLIGLSLTRWLLFTVNVWSNNCFISVFVWHKCKNSRANPPDPYTGFCPQTLLGARPSDPHLHAVGAQQFVTWLVWPSIPFK